MQIDELKIAAEHRLACLVDTALVQWPELTKGTHVNGESIPWHTPFISWYQRGQAAATANAKTGEIRCSLPLAVQAPHELLEDTLAHELAHIVSMRLHWPRRIRPHGYEWQQVTRALCGRVLDRTHRLDTSGLKARRTRYRQYLNPQDGTVHWISLRRAKRGRCFICRKTGVELVATGVVILR